MSIGFFSLFTFNFFVVLALVVLWARQSRPAKEDPRLSRGLQLLQSKIAVLEDLSDRTDTQVKQLTQILDERGKGLQSKMVQAEETLMKIEQSMRKTLDVAEIFQDKVPHQEILERNQQSKYVQAAKFANSGQSVDEILAKIDLPRSEVEFIAKVNREDLTFNPELLPEWAKNKRVDDVFQAPKTDLSSLQQIEAGFKRAVREVADLEKQAKPTIRSVKFPRIIVDRAQLSRTVIED
ncbi:MAG: hypothetical protein A2Z20_05700 [Bdellovibrionales bacterium RBG_16_40_8]|nr:MAG: hypothetical protein A2Z20_05700 [Bdellovibrionales bacterium RBG_16_40_8]